MEGVARRAKFSIECVKHGLKASRLYRGHIFYRDPRFKNRLRSPNVFANHFWCGMEWTDQEVELNSPCQKPS